MRSFQAGILAEIPRFGRYAFFDLAKGVSANAICDALGRVAPKSQQLDRVIGVGLQTAQAVGYSVAGLREFASKTTALPHRKMIVQIPSTPAALLIWLRDDAGAKPLMVLEQKVVADLLPAFRLRESVAAFKHTVGKDDTARDLTGYEDGTENPKGRAAMESAFLVSDDAVLNRSSFLAIQRWRHDWQAFRTMPLKQQDLAIGRRKSTNEELEDAPASAHVKRTAQEDFEPEAFVLRRSMPWRDKEGSGLMFAAFGKSFNAFEAQIQRMTGAGDGVVDALFQFSKPLGTSYFWCPPAIMSL